MTRFVDTRAGALKERIEFQKRVYAQDGYGNEQSSFEPVFECRAGYNSMRGSESVIAARLTGVQPLRIRVRSTTETRAVQPDWRIRDMNTNKLYALTAVVQDFDNKDWMDIFVTEGVAA